ncbi:MAG: hypothetical protein Q9163_001621 [Psora crenata]
MASRKRSEQVSVPLGLCQTKRVKKRSSIPSSSSSHSAVAACRTRPKMAYRWLSQANDDAITAKDFSLTDRKAIMLKQDSLCTYQTSEDRPLYDNKQSSRDEAFPGVQPDAPVYTSSSKAGPAAPTALLLAEMNARNNNDVADFCSIIDDLTIQNKKLRKRLKRYRRLHCPLLEEEKLFELRIHRLDAPRKRQLEDTLRNLTLSIEGDPLGKGETLEPQPARPKSLTSLQNRSSFSTLNSRPLDSAYASVSGAGANHYNPGHPRASQAVNASLRDISEALMPKHSLAMSDKSKSKLVVRRLEQIFTGKAAASRVHRQSRQQQEVSNSAAEVDSSKIEAHGQRASHEGTREARILPDDADLRVETMEEANEAAGKPLDADDGAESLIHSTIASRAASSEQRPTRPLDLDLRRAQVPSDNIEYIRHLGLVSPTDDGSIMSQSDDGWMYLNFLVGMAQLHTLNVTTEFVRKAIGQVSDMFELSVDGSKVKWLGGTEGTRMNPDGDDSEGQLNCKPSLRASVPLGNHGSLAEPSSRDELDERQEPNSALPVHASRCCSPPEIGAKRRPVHAGGWNSSQQFQYKPLFFHTARSGDEDDSGISSDSISSTDTMDFATGINTSSFAVRERQRRFVGRKRESGPIIFYNRARFCTDLGGDPDGPAAENVSYHRCTEQPLGCRQPSLSDEELDDSTDANISRADTPAVLGLGDTESPVLTRLALDLEALRTSDADCASGVDTPMSMEASGLGGVRPEDNFVVKVQRRQSVKHTSAIRLSPSPSTPDLVHKVHHSVPRTPVHALRATQHILRSGAPQALVRSEVISAAKTNMAPSPLPPPSYVRLPYSSSESDEASDEDEGELGMLDHPTPDFPEHHKPAESFIDPSPDTESTESSYETTSPGSDDSSSIDMLAHARAQDPEAVMAQEREFENNRLNQLSAVGSHGAAATPGAGAPSESASRVDSDEDSMSFDVDEESEMSDGD